MDFLKLATPPEYVMPLCSTLHLLFTESFTFFSFLSKINISSGVRFSMSLLHHFCIISERMRIVAPRTIYEKFNFVKIYVHYQWGVLLNDITDSGRVANLKMSIIRIYENFKNS